MIYDSFVLDQAAKSYSRSKFGWRSTAPWRFVSSLLVAKGTIESLIRLFCFFIFDVHFFVQSFASLFFVLIFCRMFTNSY